MKKYTIVALLIAATGFASVAEAWESRAKVRRRQLAELSAFLLDELNWNQGVVTQTRRRLMSMYENMFPQSKIRESDLREGGETLAAAATAIMVPNMDLTSNGDGTFKLKSRKSELCLFPGFLASNAKCSAFLATETKMVTALHCVRVGGGRCEDFSFVFGVNDGSEETFSRIPADNIRPCLREKDSGNAKRDWVELEIAPVTGRKPLPLDLKPARSGRNLVAVGHPHGLPTKVSEGEAITPSALLVGPTFDTTLDAIPQSSGSPVFRRSSIHSGRPRVIGIVGEGGEPEFFPSPGAMCEEVFLPCSKEDDRNCQGTIVVRSLEFARALLN